jgi:multidrug efflux pump subunit AcrA (membrane-fusion protein)
VKLKTLILAALASVTFALAQEEEAGHMHGPDGRHIAVASTFGPATGKQILSHHDLRIEGPDGKAIIGADVHSIIHKRGDPNAVIHREHNAYEAENEVYGSHMMYREPGEYTIIENITLPDKREMSVEFPIWVPAPALATTEEEHAHGPNWLLIIGGPILGLALLYVAYRAGRKSAIAGVASLILVLGTVPAYAQEEEAGHMHGPDGRHVAVASTFGESAATPLKAYPAEDLSESVTKREGDIKLVLSIENEEIETDPNVIQFSSEMAETVGLKTVSAEVAGSQGSLVTTGQVKPNPNGAVTITARAPGRVVRVGVTPGDTIGEGQVVAVIDSPDVARAQAEYSSASASSAEAKAAFLSAQSQVEAAEARLQNATANLKRQQDLAKAGAFSSPTVEDARSRVAAAEGELREAQTSYDNLQATAERMQRGFEQGVVPRNEAERAKSAADQAKSRLDTARNQLAIAKQSLTREEDIQRQGLRNAKEVQQAEAEVRIAHAGLQTSRSELAQAKAAQVRTQMAAESAATLLRQYGASPGGGSQVTHKTAIGGEVESRPISEGQTVQAGDVLARVLNTSTVWIEGDVFEKDLAKVRVGQPVTVSADALPGRTFQGTVDYIAAEVNTQSRAVRVRTVVKQSDELLKPNMFARMILGGGGEGMVAVPAVAIQEDAGSQVVFVEAEPGSYRRTVVQVASTLGDRVLISQGLGAGDKVVTQGSYQLLAKAKGG